MKQLVWLGLATLSLSGCAMFTQPPDEPVISSLEPRPILVDKRPITDLDKREIIENYRAMLYLQPEQQLASEVTRRLADLELDQSESRLLDQGQATPAVTELRSIELYEALLRHDPNYPNRDLLLYQLSRAYELAGDQQQMLQSLNQLANSHPDSSHWPEAQFRRGERLFLLQRYPQAEAAYGAILKQAKGSTYFERALFKHGWARFKQRRIEAGLDSFTQLLDRKFSGLAVIEASQLSPADQELLRETLRVISLTFSELGGTQKIQHYFAHQGQRDYEFMIYQGLGDLYQQQGRIQDAAEAYLAFVKLDPAHPQAPRLAVQVIKLYRKHNFPALALQSQKAFTQLYQLQGGYWQSLDEDNRRWVADRLRSYLKELAEYHHALVQQTDKVKHDKPQAANQQLGDEAILWYQRYLGSFPNESTTGSMSFLLGELLFELSHFTEAVVAYENSAYHYPEHPQRAEAGYAALLAYSAEEQQRATDSRQAWRRKGIDSALRFADSFPQEPRTAAVLTQAADQLLALHELALARQTALRVTAMQPPAKTELLRTAWAVAAHGAFEQQQYEAAEQAYLQAIRLLPTEDRSRDELRERLAASIYQQGVVRREAGDQQAAAEQFLRVGLLTPGATIRATAEFDAAASLIALQQWPRAIQILEDFRLHYPQSSLLPEINNKLAVAYLQTQQPLKAAAELSSIAQQGENPELRREAGWQAAELYAAAENISKAISTYKYYVTHFPHPLDQAMEARQRLSELYITQGQHRKSRYWLEEIIKADASAGENRTDRSRFLAAHASLKLAQPAYDQFQQVQLVAPLKTNLKLKKHQMQRAIANYRQAADYGIAEVTTAATFRIGELYQLFGEALLESERPQGLNEEELEQYEILLEEQAYPFEDKSIALHETNTQRVLQGIYDPWVQQSFDALARLLPVRYAKTERVEELFDGIN